MDDIGRKRGMEGYRDAFFSTTKDGVEIDPHLKGLIEEIAIEMQNNSYLNIMTSL